jgi:hypothetical protein
MNSQLGARLKSMLLVDVDDQSESESSAFPSAYSVQDKNDAANAKKKILIEEVDDRETKRNNARNLPVDPCLVTNEASSTLSAQTMQRIGVESMTKNTSSDAPSSSLAEQMMTAAASAQTSQKERQRSEQQNRAKKATFGMKKGFLMKKDKKKKSSSTTKNVQVVRNVVRDVVEKVRKTFLNCFSCVWPMRMPHLLFYCELYTSLTRTISFRILAPKDTVLLLQTHSIFLKFKTHCHHIFNLPSPNGHLRPSSTLLPSIQHYQKDGTIQNTLLRYIV